MLLHLLLLDYVVPRSEHKLRTVCHWNAPRPTCHSTQQILHRSIQQSRCWTNCCWPPKLTWVRKHKAWRPFSIQWHHLPWTKIACGRCWLLERRISYDYDHNCCHPYYYYYYYYCYHYEHSSKYYTVCAHQYVAPKYFWSEPMLTSIFEDVTGRT